MLFFTKLLESAEGNVQLVLEAFSWPDNPMDEETKYGEAVFDVFPRKATLFSALRRKTPSDRDSSNLYQFETNIKLTQLLEDEGFTTSCGVIRAIVKLEQVKEPETEFQGKYILLYCKLCVVIYLCYVVSLNTSNLNKI